MQFRAEDGTVERRLGTRRVGDKAFALSPDDRTLAVCNRRSGVELIDLTSEGRDFKFTFPERPAIEGMRVSPDKRTLLAWSDHEINLYRSDSMQRIGSTTVLRSIHDACFSPDGRQLALARKSPGAKFAFVDLIEPATGRVSKSLRFEDGRADAVAFVDSSHLVVAEGQILSLTQIDTQKTLWRKLVTEGRNTIERVAVSPDGRTVAAIVDLRSWEPGDINAQQGAVYLLDAKNGASKGDLTATGLPTRTQFATNNHLLVAMSTKFQTVGRTSPVLIEWDVRKHEILEGTHPIDLDLNVIFDPILSYDSARHRVLLTGGTGASTTNLAIWDLTASRQLEQLKLRGPIVEAQFLNNDRVAILQRNGCLVIIGPEKSRTPGNGR